MSLCSVELLTPLLLMAIVKIKSSGTFLGFSSTFVKQISIVSNRTFIVFSDQLEGQAICISICTSPYRHYVPCLSFVSKNSVLILKYDTIFCWKLAFIYDVLRKLFPFIFYFLLSVPFWSALIKYPISFVCVLYKPEKIDWTSQGEVFNHSNVYSKKRRKEHNRVVQKFNHAD